MQKTVIAWVAGAALALGSTAFAQNSDPASDTTQGSQSGQMGSQSGQMQGSQSGQMGSSSGQMGSQQGQMQGSLGQNQNLTHLSGVVTKIDPTAKSMTIVLPGGSDVATAQVGKSVLTDRGVNLVSIQAPIDQGAPIYVDGKPARLSDLKEGDVVRTSFDPNKTTFEGVAAVSQQQIDQDVSTARKNLKQELNTQLNPSSNQPSNQMNQKPMNQ